MGDHKSPLQQLGASENISRVYLDIYLVETSKQKHVAAKKLQTTNNVSMDIVLAIVSKVCPMSNFSMDIPYMGLYWFVPYGTSVVKFIECYSTLITRWHSYRS